MGQQAEQHPVGTFSLRSVHLREVVGVEQADQTESWHYFFAHNVSVHGVHSSEGFVQVKAVESSCSQQTERVFLRSSIRCPLQLVAADCFFVVGFFWGVEGCNLSVLKTPTSLLPIPALRYFKERGGRGGRERGGREWGERERGGGEREGVAVGGGVNVT